MVDYRLKVLTPSPYPTSTDGVYFSCPPPDFLVLVV